jgi:hypothetical protein
MMACNGSGKAKGMNGDCWLQLRLQRRQPRNKLMDVKMTSFRLPTDKKTSFARLKGKP